MRVKRADPAVRSLLLAAACAAALACGGLQSPTEPQPNPDSSSASGPGDGSLIIGAPAPAATPTPSPSPADGGQPSPAPGGEDAAGCGTPLPPAVSEVRVKVHLRGAEAWILDSTPVVGPDVEYCAKIGFTDGRSFCAVRPEGHPQRASCELYAVGRAKDTNRPGPTWYHDGGFCRGRSSGCENNPENQYLLNTWASGSYKACAANGVCGEVDVDR